MTEIELLERARMGDKLAFQSLVEYFEQTIAAVVKGILGDCPDAEDTGQEVFIRFYKSMHQFKGQSTLKTYLVCIAVNLSLNELKKRKRLINYNSEVIHNHTIIQNDESINFENRELIDMALNKLSPRQRSIVVLRLIEGYSVKETAGIMNIPEGTVLSGLSRAQGILKRILAPFLNTVV